MASALAACAGPGATGAPTSETAGGPLGIPEASEAVAQDFADPAAAAAAPPSGLDPAGVARLVDLGRRDSRVMEHLDELVNGIGPRLTGSSNLEQAEAWAVGRFRSWGLVAGLQPWGEMGVRFDRGPSSGAAWVEPAPAADGSATAAAPVRTELVIQTNAWTPGTGGPRRARAVLAPTAPEEIDASADALRGAWVVLAPGTPPPMRNALERRAGDLALAGLVQGGASNGLLLTGGRPVDSVDQLPALPRVSVLREQFDGIVERLRAGQPVELEFDIDNRTTPGPVTQNTVVADLVGSEWPDEYVIVGGHLDSWDGATGTTDNGTGVATTLEAARLLAESGLAPKRTIRFMLWSGEEQGLLGSSAWVAANPAVLPAISAVLVHDGGTAFVSGLGVTAPMAAQARAATAAARAFVAAEGEPYRFELREVPGLDSDGASDHASFAAAGVPGFFWDQAGGIDYDHTHHTQYDTFDAARADYQRHSAVVIALVAAGIADLPEKLDRDHLLVERRRLGVFLAGDGVTVRAAAPGSRAAEVGMGAGDVIASVDGEAVTGGNLGALLARGEPRKLVAWRHGEEARTSLFEWDHGDITHPPEAVSLRAGDGVELAADYYIGAVAGPAHGSALVLLPMNGASRATWTPVRDALYRAGIATLAVDLRGFGESAGPDGSLAARVAARDTSLYPDMDLDAAAAVAWLESRGYEPGRIGLMGASVGCSVALRAAVADPRLAGVAALTPGSAYLGLDSLATIALWDERPLLLASSDEEAGGGARPLHAALLARDPAAPVELLLVPETDVHGTRMFGKVPGIEQRLAEWWTGVLRTKP